MGDEGATALAATLKETKITNLECAAAPEVFAFLSAPVDTPLLSHRFPSCPSLVQPRMQQHRCQGRHRARCHPQRDGDNQPQVRRRRRSVCFFVSAPIDTLSTASAPMLAVSRLTNSVVKE